MSSRVAVVTFFELSTFVHTQIQNCTLSLIMYVQYGGLCESAVLLCACICIERRQFQGEDG